MADPVINTLSLCSGYAGLDIGLEAACGHLGFESRTVAYVEWEAYAAALLVARMEAGHLAAAPVWCGDIGKLNGADFRGAVDCVTAGFPCQPHSQAGARKGVNDERWIWPDIAGIIRDSGAWLVVLENVSGLLSSGGFGPVLSDLAEMGFDAEWGVLSAAAVGASHRRKRVFIMGYSECARWASAWSGRQEHTGWKLESGCVAVADPDRTHHEGRRQCRDEGGRQEPHGHAGLEGGELFAPGPSAPEWEAIIADYPHLAPAVESSVRVLADGASVVVDAYRRHQLRLTGNGVVPLQAAAAIVRLVERLGITNQEERQCK